MNEQLENQKMNKFTCKSLSLRLMYSSSLAKSSMKVLVCLATFNVTAEGTYAQVAMHDDVIATSLTWISYSASENSLLRKSKMFLALISS